MDSSQLFSNERAMAVIAYFGWWVTGVMLLVAEKDNSFIRFHAMQSTIFFGFVTLMFIFLLFIPPLWTLNLILSPLSFVYWLYLMYQAYEGEEYEIPYIGQMAKKQLDKME